MKSSNIGGQAVMEGIMMRHKDKYAIAVRRPSAILDCVAKDASNRQFNVEIQGDNEGASPKRARYHCGLLDMNILNPRESFDALPDTYVIFITRNDRAWRPS